MSESTDDAVKSLAWTMYVARIDLLRSSGGMGAALPVESYSEMQPEMETMARAALRALGDDDGYREPTQTAIGDPCPDCGWHDGEHASDCKRWAPLPTITVVETPLNGGVEAALREALQELSDWQNGPPLMGDKWENGWGNAIRLTDAALALTPSGAADAVRGMLEALRANAADAAGIAWDTQGDPHMLAERIQQRSAGALRRLGSDAS